MPQIVLRDGTVLRRAIDITSLPVAPARRYVCVEDLETKITEFQEAWFEAARESGQDIRDMSHIDMMRVIDDFCHMVGIDIDTGDDDQE